MKHPQNGLRASFPAIEARRDNLHGQVPPFLRGVNPEDNLRKHERQDVVLLVVRVRSFGERLPKNLTSTFPQVLRSVGDGQVVKETDLIQTREGEWRRISGRRGGLQMALRVLWRGRCR